MLEKEAESKGFWAGGMSESAGSSGRDRAEQAEWLK